MHILEDNNIGVASDDIGIALKQALSSLEEYKAACYSFVTANSWERTANSLLEHIEKL